MEEKNYPSNSKLSREEEPKTNQNGKVKKVEVVSTQAIQRKPPLGKRFAAMIVGEGADASSVWSFLLTDVLVPSVKATLTTAISQGAEHFFYGSVGSRNVLAQNAMRQAGNTAQIAYNRIAGGGTILRTPEPQVAVAAQTFSPHTFGEVLLPTRSAAQDALDQMYTLLSDFQEVSVADLYSSVGITPEWTHNRYGWTDLTGAHVMHVKDGYLLKLPRPVVLKS